MNVDDEPKQQYGPYGFVTSDYPHSSLTADWKKIGQLSIARKYDDFEKMKIDFMAKSGISSLIWLHSPPA